MQEKTFYKAAFWAFLQLMKAAALSLRPKGFFDACRSPLIILALKTADDQIWNSTKLP